jgi:hypothetical protein
MNDEQKEVFNMMIPLIRKYIPAKIMADIAGVQPMIPTKEDLWKMCIAISMGKKHGLLVKPKR